MEDTRTTNTNAAAAACPEPGTWERDPDDPRRLVCRPFPRRVVGATVLSAEPDPLWDAIWDDTDTTPEVASGVAPSAPRKAGEGDSIRSEVRGEPRKGAADAPPEAPGSSRPLAVSEDLIRAAGLSTPGAGGVR